MRLSRGHVFWSGLEAGVSACLSFLSAFVIARMIGPAELGTGAAVVAMHVLLWVGVNALFADALVQQDTVEHTTASSAFWASSLVGTIAALAQAASGWLLARAFADPRLVAMALVLAAPLPLVGAGGAVQGMLTRRQAYRVLAGRAIVGQGLGTVTGIAAALAGAGAWALVVQQCVTSTAGALALLCGGRWRPLLVLRWPTVRKLLRTGLPLTASTLVQNARYRLFVMLIGGTAGPAALGVVHLAFRLADTVRDLALTALWRLMLPVMSRCQQDLGALQASVDRYGFLAGLALFPVVGAMLVTMRPLVRLVLGPIWEPAASAALPLLGLTAWVFLGFAGGVAMVARGGARYAMVSQLAVTGATLLGVIVLRPATPVAAVSVWAGAQLLVSPYLVLRISGTMRSRPLRQHRPGLPALGLAALAAIGALAVPGRLGPAELIAGRLAVFLLVYGLGAAWALLRAGGRAASPGLADAGTSA